MTPIQELQALVQEVGARVPHFCNPVPSREKWDRIEALVNQIAREDSDG